ncbi:hypothetical protein F5Y16DRAFT_397499 [Xylariaceae sp. FL0255]|nr:hypothetical protein F5Y16DRAFT_397499 [Xylariaceae sp. FL0255]
MSYVQDMTRAPMFHPRDTSGKAEVSRYHPRKQHNGRSKSSPLDADDLRRRLYVVIAEREAKNEQRQREMVDSLPAKDAQMQREKSVRQQERHQQQQKQINQHQNPASRHMNPGTTLMTMEMPVSAQIPLRTATASKPPKSKSSLQDKLRHKHSKTASSRIEHNNVSAQDADCTRQYIPQSAAAQFARTTTSVEAKKSLVHGLSAAALRFHTQGSTTADRDALVLGDSTITPAKQRGLLHRVHKQRDLLHERNQFQEPSSKIFGEKSEESGNSHLMSWRHWNGPSGGFLYHSNNNNNNNQQAPPLGKAIEAMILDDHGADMRALVDLNNGRYCYNEYNRNGNGNGNGNERQSSGDTLVDKMARAMEHRIDWTQSDEMLPHEKRGVLQLKTHPLLRKTSSIWTLKGRLGGHRRKKSGDEGVENHHHPHQQQQQQLDIVAEEFDAGRGETGAGTVAEINIDDESTPMSLDSGNSQTKGLRIFRKLRI